MSENVFDDKALQQYLNQIAKIPTLSREKEQELAIKAQKGDKAAIEKLVESNLKFVVKIASRYQNRGLSLAELISEGNIGLIRAIEKFDPSKQNKLISYAVWWIKQKILFALAEKTNVIRMPLGKSNMVHKLRKARNKIFSETGYNATMEEVMEKTNFDERAIKKLDMQRVKTLSIDESSFSNKDDRVTIKDFLADPSVTDPKTLYYQERLHNSIEESLKSLPSRDAYIVKQYFGLDGNSSKNFAQIGEELGLSRERVRQIQKKALEKIYKDTYSEIEKDIDHIL
ncbi:MAG: RNA polymerase sigma factor RpoD/SigA [Candidatus Cloacimonetes bacterium]|nr:RNA polymerase sigma factor RpoD/SigA [Candidatus Cloacimonadota bacterium]